MKRAYYLVLGAVAVLLALVLSQLQSPSSADPLAALDQLRGGAYTQAVAAHRQAKDQAFRAGKDSPLPAGQRAPFQGLAYYAPIEAWRLMAQWQPSEAAEPVPGLRGAGRLHFSVAGQPQVLSAYYEETPTGAAPRLFIPYQDSTSGHETYGGGRYLTLSMPPPDQPGAPVLLDFNLAYHPYCVYSPAYLCPVPPAGNRLPQAVRAGERLPQVVRP